MGNAINYQIILGWGIVPHSSELDKLGYGFPLATFINAIDECSGKCLFAADENTYSLHNSIVLSLENECVI